MSKEPIFVEIEAAKLPPREPFAGEHEMEDGRIVTYRQRLDISPDAVELTCDGVSWVQELPIIPFRKLPDAEGRT